MPSPVQTLPNDAAWAFEYFTASGQVLSPAEVEQIPVIAASVLAVTARIRNIVSPELPFTPVYSVQEGGA